MWRARPRMIRYGRENVLDCVLGAVALEVVDPVPVERLPLVGREGADSAFAGPSELMKSRHSASPDSPVHGQTVLGELELEVATQHLPHVFAPGPVAGTARPGRPHVADPVHRARSSGFASQYVNPRRPPGMQTRGDLSCHGAMVDREYDAVGRGHHVETGVPIRKALDVADVEAHGQALLSSEPLRCLDQLRRQVLRRDLGSRPGSPQGDGAGAGRQVEPALARARGARRATSSLCTSEQLPLGDSPAKTRRPRRGPDRLLRRLAARVVANAGRLRRRLRLDLATFNSIARSRLAQKETDLARRPRDQSRSLRRASCEPDHSSSWI